MSGCGLLIFFVGMIALACAMLAFPPLFIPVIGFIWLTDKISKRKEASE